MSLELNMWVKKIPTTFSKSSNNIMKSWNIGREMFLQALTWNGIILPSTMNATTASQSKDTLRNYFSDLATTARPSLSFHPTSITRFTMEPRYNCPQRRQPSQVSMLRELNVSRQLWQKSSSMDELSITNCWLPSMPFSLNRIQSLKLLMRPLTNYLTTWTLTLTRLSYTDP